MPLLVFFSITSLSFFLLTSMYVNLSITGLFSFVTTKSSMTNFLGSDNFSLMFSLIFFTFQA